MIGLYYYLERRPIALPLLNVSTEAAIKELAAQVKLTQTYGNDANFPIEAVYAFPVPARAAVCSFVMIKHDGTRVAGLVQEKQEARETYHTAITQGRQASLMEQQTPDVFQVAVGNIPPKEQVKIELVYATELSEDEENDSVRFHLPVHIGARYGRPPTSPLSPRNPFANPFFASASPKSCFLEISMSVESIAPITKISCPSHAVSTEIGPDPALPNFKELPFSNYARVSLSSNSPLNQDFVLAIKSAGLDAPRCVAEVHPDPSHDTVAMALTFVPRFKLPDPARQELIFLVDRSGSMHGARIAAARKALVVLLRSLPHKDSLFQIMSFGNGATSLWERGSKPYNQETLEQATSHVDRMEADYGGTEIRGALEACFAGRTLDRPTSVFMLTDGEAWNLDAVLGEVRAAVGAAPESAPLRVSVLGIGDTVSTAMCEGIARAGHGVCMLVGEQETSFTGKIARLLKASKTPVISNISVDWGRPAAEVVTAPESEDDFEVVEEAVWARRKTLNIFDPSVDPTRSDETQAPPPPPVILPTPSAMQQSPFKIRNVFPGVRLNVYAILKGRTVPKIVIFRGSTPEGADIELPIPVTLSRLQNDPGAPTAIHALAARKIIQDLEDGQYPLRTTLSNPDDTDLLARTVKASIVRLGKTYSISSKHTSFVAVDEATLLPPPVAVGREELGDTVQFIRSGIRASPAPPPPRAASIYYHRDVSARVLPADQRVLYPHSDRARDAHARARAPPSPPVSAAPPPPPPPSFVLPVMGVRRGRPNVAAQLLVPTPTGFSGVDPAALAALSEGSFDEDSWHAAGVEVGDGGGDRGGGGDGIG
ncbi:von Willebrand factor type A domain-containing protein [Mycena albidolilacea]|uniref:von Willebrand factor type A domain-containing protein n=1 Tax=Mycena albidolilacea TaxID=1033008 RepID=A0AAD7A9N8_9AGAR|nr:von Willebrand factor type A domain-containing protein [Mycena albidolilacea]